MQVEPTHTPGGKAGPACPPDGPAQAILPADGCPQAPSYPQRDPRKTPLYRLVVDHFETLLAGWEDRFQPRNGFLPAHVERLVDAYLRCGLHGAGFARVVCADCKHEFLVAFSCKARFLCPSCHERKALVWSEWVADEVAEDVAHRMWVLTIPKRVRRFFLFDRSLLGELSRAAAKVVQGFFHDVLGRDDVKPGIVSVIHTFNSDLEWNPHLHLLVTEGAFAADGEFLPLSVTDPRDLGRIEEAFRQALLAMLVARDLLTRDDVLGMLLWPHSGFRVDTRVQLAPGDREGIVELAKYLAHGPVALGRTSYPGAGGQVRLRLRRPHWETGKWEVVLDPLHFLARLLMHVPPPHLKMWRQYGAYAAVVRAARSRAPEGRDGGAAGPAAAPPPTTPSPSPHKQRCSSLWAALLSRVYGFDPLVCPRCGGRMKVLAVLQDPASIRRILDHLGVDGSVPPLQPSRAPPVYQQGALALVDVLPAVDDLVVDAPWQDDVPIVAAG